jgi:DnaJ family protein C protein 11
MRLFLLKYFFIFIFIYRLTRANHSFSAPILLHSNPSPSFVMWSAIVPVAFSLMLKILVLDPRERRKRAKKLRFLREKNVSLMKERKKEAEEAMSIMKDFVDRRREVEESHKGLIIVEAYYGNLGVDKERLKDTEFPPIINVTLPLQSLVQDSQLHLHNTTKVSRYLYISHKS